MVVHRCLLAVSCAVVSVAAFALPAAARELVILEADGFRDSGNDLGRLVEEFLAQEGAFAGLALQSDYSMTLDYLGIADAITVEASSSGNDIVLSFPSTGFSRSFSGASPDDVEEQVEDFFESSQGADALAKFLEETNARTPLATTDGNPRATTALFARGAFDRFGLGPPRTRAGYRDAQVAEWGHIDLRAELGGGALDVESFESLYVVDGALTLGGDFEPGVGVYLSLLGQYRSYDGASIYDAGLELGVPVAILRPGGSSALRWTLTPVVQAGLGVSVDLISGGAFVGGGGVSSFGYHRGPFELTLANALLYYGGISVGEVGGVELETELDQLLTRNGGKVTYHPPDWAWAFAETGVSFTSFLTSDAAVDFYTTPFVGIGATLGDGVTLRLGWESDLGDDYAAHLGKLDLGFAF